MFRFDDSTIVNTNRGMIKGYFYHNLYMFKGIPYAKVERRWHKAKAYNWEGVFDATNYGCVCPLLDNGKPQGELKVPHRFWVEDDMDCTNLNIWTPALDNKKRPVFFWIHGGGYSAGSSIEQIAYEGENMATEGDVVVVSINHRLNIFGYFNLSEYGKEYENSANCGMDDIIEALKFVRENIEKFGGDKDNVTICGQSGGGGKVATLIQMKEADGLFHKAIAMSGIHDAPSECDSSSKKNIAEAIIKELNLESLEQLEETDYRKLAEGFAAVYKGKSTFGLFEPNVNDYFRGNANRFGFREETKDIPMLVGSVFGEMGGFFPNKYDRNNISKIQGEDIVRNEYKKNADKVIELMEKGYPDRNPADVNQIDFRYRQAIIKYVKNRGKLNKCTYNYLFNRDFPIDGGCVPWHCSDIPFVFHNTDLIPCCDFEGAKHMEEKIFTTVLAFMRTGNPNNELISEWKPCDENNCYTMLFDDNTKLVCNHDEVLIDLVAEKNNAEFNRKMAENMSKIQR